MKYWGFVKTVMCPKHLLCPGIKKSVGKDYQLVKKLAENLRILKEKAQSISSV